MNKIFVKFGIVILGLAALVATYILVISDANSLLRQSITRTTQASNATITKIFVNDVFPQINPVLNIETRTNGLEGRDLAFVDLRIRTFMLGSDILKTKIFNKTGTTLYSTEHAQIGESRKNNKAFQAALEGGIGSQITHKGKFSAIDEIVFERDLVASYVPIRNAQGQVIGVTEIYTDRTLEVSKIPTYLATLKGTLILTLSFCALIFALQFWASLLTSSKQEE